MVTKIIDESIAFVDQVYIPDLMAIASFYKDWLYGGGLSSKCVMSYGDIPKSANNYKPENLMLPRGAIIDGNLNEVHDVDLREQQQIQEYVTHSWYKYEDEKVGLHPWDGVTQPNFDLGGAKGTRTRIEAGGRDRQVLVDQVAALERPRDGGRPARALHRRLRAGPAGVQGARRRTARASSTCRSRRCSRRSAARRRAASRRSWAAHKLKAEHEKLIANIKAGDRPTANSEKWDPSTWPKDVQGRRLHRGAARRARPLGAHQGRQDRQLPVHRADDLERRPARPRRQPRRVRGVADGHADGESANSRSRSCAPSTASTRASRARRTCWT